MDHGDIGSAFEPFVAELRKGGFVEPAEGWTAELVAAHIARNSELIAELAEKVEAGEEPSYDNAASIDEAALRVYVEEIGEMPGLITSVQATASRLAAARRRLDETTEAFPVRAMIRDGGRVVNDGPIPIAKLIEGHASFHLDAHLEQLKALRG